MRVALPLTEIYSRLFEGQYVAAEEFALRSDNTVATYGIPCVWCQRFIHDGKWTCSAFPNGIPREVFNGKNTHQEPIRGDHGLQYKFDPSSGFPFDPFGPDQRASRLEN